MSRKAADQGKPVRVEFNRWLLANGGKVYDTKELEQCKRELAATRELLVITERLLSEREKVLRAIPECPLHGESCVPYALEWIANTRKQLAFAARACEPMVKK